MSLNRIAVFPGISRRFYMMSRASYSTDGAGAIREAGGVFGKKEAADEERYFRKLQNEQLKTLKTHLDEEIVFHQGQIKTHQEQIVAHEKRIEELNKKKPA